MIYGPTVSKLLQEPNFLPCKENLFRKLELQQFRAQALWKKLSPPLPQKETETKWCLSHTVGCARTEVSDVYIHLFQE